MAGSTLSLCPSIVAALPPLSCPGGWRTGCRVVGLAASTRSHGLCRNNGVRIRLGGFLAHWRVRTGVGGGNGVVRALEETKAPPKSRRRTKKPVKEVEGEEVRLDVSDGAESDSGQSSSSDTATPASKRRTSARGRKAKVAEVNGSSPMSERQDAETESNKVSAIGAEEELVASSKEANPKVGSRRRRRPSPKSGGAENPKTTASAILSQVSESEVDASETVEEDRHSIESPVEIETGEKEVAAPSVTRSRRRKKVAAKAPEATTNGSAATAMDAEDSSVSIRELEDVALSPSPAREEEHVHREELGLAEEPSDSSGSASVAEAKVAPERKSKGLRSRKKRGKAANNGKSSGDKELQIRVQETAVPSLNGGVEKSDISGAISDEGESEAGVEIQSPRVEVKKKRQRRTRRKSVAVADLDENILETSAAAQAVLLGEPTGGDSELNSDSEEDEAVSGNHEDSVSHAPGFEESPPRKSSRSRRRDAQKQAAVQAESNGEGGGGDTASESGAVMRNMFSNGSAFDSPEAGTLWSGSQIDTDGGVSRVQFPAPTWGPEWWGEIQTKSQATISFQDIAERKEGFQTRAKGLWLLVSSTCLICV